MLQQLDDGLWVIDLPLKMPGGVQIGTRTSLIRLPDGSLFVHSPGPIGNADLDEIAALGDVRHVVAPNLFHCLFVEEFMTAHEGASLYAPPGFEAKVAGIGFEPLTDVAPTAWADQLDQVAVQGAPRLSEIVFFHRASRTLLLTDLCFNMRHSDSLVTRIFMSVMGGYGHFGPSRLARFMMQDKRAVKTGIERALDFDFDRVIVTHGDVVETAGHEALREAFSGLG